MESLEAEARNVHWGFFDRGLSPALTVPSGGLVRVETITHHAGDAPDLLMDQKVRRLFDEVQDRGPGPHILLGPIAVEGAAPGDVLAVRIVSLKPMFDYGSNLAANWGFLYRDFGKERVTIWSLDLAANRARAEYAFDWKATPVVDRPGTIVPPESTSREQVLEGLEVPLRPHLGTMGVARAQPGRHSSVPPGDFGGNIDNWRTAAGTTMYYPVQVPGALLSLGDPHVAQGDGELSGTALEASLEVVLEIEVLSDKVFEVPILETPTHWYVHGFGDRLDDAMDVTSRRVLRFLTRGWGMSRDDAYSLMSVAVDFGVTQVVDQRLGVHGAVAKSLVGPIPMVVS